MINIFFFLVFISLRASCFVLTGEEINRLCKEKIQSLVSDGRIEVIERKIPDIVLCDGSLRLELSPSISFNSAVVNIDVFVDGKLVRRIKPCFKIKRFKNVVVCLKQIKPKETITEDMVTIEEREITHTSGYIEKIDDAVLKEAKRRIEEGEIILSNNIKEKPVINFGDIVTIIKRGDGFFIKAKGMAISTGYKGKSISVRNLSSQRIVEGIVINKEEVEIR